jgi:hypothetical protein
VECALCVGRVEVHLLLCVSSVAADSLRGNFRTEAGRTFGSDEALQGVIVMLLVPFNGQETQHPTSSLPGPQRVVS